MTELVTDLAAKSILLIALFASGYCIALFAHNVRRLWVVWLLTTGFFIGSALAPTMTAMASIVCALSILAMFVALIMRRLPVHSLAWGVADRIEISALAEEWTITLTDPQEIATLMQYGESGHYRSMLKCGSRIHLAITRGNQTTGYYIHGNAVGTLPGGMSQTIFVPRRAGLLTDLRALLARHGHADALPGG